jgi:hypothetical protein
MSTLAAKQLNEALAKAKDIGLVEESFTIEDCEITLRNLRPEEYTAAVEACDGLDGVTYMLVYQKEHLARSIVEINGMDLRKTKYIEEQEPDPKDPVKLRTVKTELHTYLLKNVVSTWGKEALYVAYRKFSDVLELAERKAKEGVEFLLADESDEEKYRRLLLEAKESASDLPDSLVDHILEEHGLMRKTTAEEVKAAMERTDKMAREDAETVPETPEAKETEDVEEAPKEPEVKATVSEEEPEIKEAIPEEIVRQPLNQAPGKQPPKDPHQTLQQVIEARRKAPVQSDQKEGDSKNISRAAEIAALESDAGIGVEEKLPSGKEIPVQQSPKSEVAELRKQQKPVDPKQVAAILDQPPVSGINPRFKPPAKV